jgi:hypothetical protein
VSKGPAGIVYTIVGHNNDMRYPGHPLKTLTVDVTLPSLPIAKAFTTPPGVRHARITGSRGHWQFVAPYQVGSFSIFITVTPTRHGRLCDNRIILTLPSGARGTYTPACVSA